MALIKCPECGADISDKALRCPKCGHNFNNVQSTAAPNSNDLANWLEEIPFKGFSNSVRISTIIVSILAIIAAISMLTLMPGLSEQALKHLNITDIFEPFKIGLYVVIAANVAAMIIAILNRRNNSHAVATGIIGSLLAYCITMMAVSSQTVSNIDAIYHYYNLSGKFEDLYMLIMFGYPAYIAITFAIYMIIAVSIAVSRRRYVTGLMAYPAIDRETMQAMQKYCNSRSGVIICTLLGIVIGIILMYVITVTTYSAKYNG